MQLNNISVSNLAKIKNGCSELQLLLKSRWKLVDNLLACFNHLALLCECDCILNEMLLFVALVNFKCVCFCLDMLLEVYAVSLTFTI